ncbi:hypothetical protein SAMN05421854_106146 [Amycolatopsis rubida]|uniref:Uncharacterized protein n=1 Tax=Amycolatopsis rubida TaxID=112413 RepID=A0A1I5S2H1_9PSEU|nr:hypothetical protein SAMN05421854_106146 [Amycolatopsis rubida]
MRVRDTGDGHSAVPVADKDDDVRASAADGGERDVEAPHPGRVVLAAQVPVLVPSDLPGKENEVADAHDRGEGAGNAVESGGLQVRGHPRAAAPAQAVIAASRRAASGGSVSRRTHAM